jgi:hypothetical protein
MSTAAVDRCLEDAEPRFRALRRRATVHESDAIGGPNEIAADWRWGGPQRPAKRAVDGARMAEIVAHEAFNALARGRPSVSQHVGGALLELVTKHVVMTFRLVVENRTNPQQKFLGVLQRAGTCAALREKPRAGQHRNRLGAKQIAEATRASFTSGSS